jgi:hypothetical protein
LRKLVNLLPNSLGQNATQHLPDLADLPLRDLG